MQSIEEDQIGQKATAQEDQNVDQALVRAFLKQRSEESFRLLYRRHTPAMLRLGQRLTYNGEAAAEDAVQEAWARAVRLLPQFQWRSSLRSWLGGIVLNVIRELRRAAGKGARVIAIAPEEIGAVGGRGPDPVEIIAITDALRDLPEGYRTVIALHDLDGFTHQEIANILRIDVGTSKSQLARARARLRNTFDEQAEEMDQ